MHSSKKLLERIVFSLAIVLCHCTVYGNNDEPSVWNTVFEQEGLTFILQSENDSYLVTDNNYTNGLRLALQSNYKNDSEAKLKDGKGRNYRLSVDFHIANNIYTGSNIKLSPDDIPDNDRPYAGWSYFGTTKERVFVDESSERWEFDVGCIGPCAGSDKIQTQWHKLVHAPEPQGWSNQISNALAIQFFHDRRLPIADWMKAEVNGQRWFDISPVLHGELGTVFTSIGAGAKVRLGLLDNYYDGPGDNSALPKLFSSGKEQQRPFLEEVYFFAKGKARYMVYNATIEGGIFNNDSPFTQDIRRMVYDLETGLTLHTQVFSLIVSVSSRSTEVKAQDFKLRDHWWGGVTISYHHM